MRKSIDKAKNSDIMNLRKRKKKGGEVVFHKDKFCGKVREHGLTLDKIAEYLGINPATLSRKMNGSSDFTRNELELLRQKLLLSSSEFQLIFFGQ